MDQSKVCPWWMGYVLLIPIRKIRHNPRTMVGPFLKAGMKAIDYGSAMGYFSIPMAKMVGDEGKIICFDIEPRMLSKLTKRAKKAGVEQRIETRLITGDDSNFSGMEQLADFALLFAVAHEVPDQEALFAHLGRMLKRGAHLYFGEPAGHVTVQEFEQSIGFAQKAGFRITGQANLKKLTAILEKR
jgi:ubiquinone/menaquinone biosynthesis C-methylase UbiE